MVVAAERRSVPPVAGATASGVQATDRLHTHNLLSLPSVSSRLRLTLTAYLILAFAIRLCAVCGHNLVWRDIIAHSYCNHGGVCDAALFGMY